MSSVNLKSVLKSEALYVDRGVEVKDRSGGRLDSGRGGSDAFWPVVGNLKVTMGDYKTGTRGISANRIMRNSTL